MGQKAHPKGLRLGIVKDWESTWFATKDYKKYLLEDYEVKNFLYSELYRSGVGEVHINRKADYIECLVSVARPGIILSASGIDLEILKKQLENKYNKRVTIKLLDEKSQDLNSRLLSQWITAQLEKRVPFRRVMKMAVQRAMKSGAKGVKVSCSGRLGGVEIARSEWYREGKVPLHTLRANIDYAFTEALTTFGKIGVKVWIYKGEQYSKSYKLQNRQPIVINKKNEKRKVEAK